MTAASLVEPGPERNIADQASDAALSANEDLGAFLGTIAKLLHETVVKFERTSSKITEIVVSQPGRTDRDLVLALQDFDRLQQEFSALGEALARTGESAATGRWSEGEGEDHARHEVIGAISIADLKERILTHLNGPSAGPSVEDLYEQSDAVDGMTVAEF